MRIITLALSANDLIAFNKVADYVLQRLMSDIPQSIMDDLIENCKELAGKLPHSQGLDFVLLNRVKSKLELLVTLSKQKQEYELAELFSACGIVVNNYFSKNGVEFSNYDHLSDSPPAELKDIGLRLRGYVPQEVRDKTRELLKDIRAKRPCDIEYSKGWNPVADYLMGAPIEKASDPTCELITLSLQKLYNDKGKVLSMSKVEEQTGWNNPKIPFTERDSKLRALSDAIIKKAKEQKEKD